MSKTPAYSRKVLDLFDAFVHGRLDRRGFLEGAAAQVGTLAAAGAVLAALTPDFVAAQVVAPADARIAAETVAIPSPAGYGTIRAYVARSAGPARGKRPVVHEDRGLNPHIEDIARRLAVDGFVAVAPDALTPLGGYPGTEDAARALFPQLDQAKVQADFLAAAGWAASLPDGNGRLGAVGFCYGGGIVNMLATRLPGLRAGVAFYGQPPRLEDVPAMRAEMLIHHAGNDQRLLAAWPAYEAALRAARIRYAGHVYPGVEHGFNNDTTPRYDKAAAALAWRRTPARFRRTLA